MGILLWISHDGYIGWYLHAAINATDEKCTMSQAAYIESLLVQCNLIDAKNVSTLMTKIVFDEVQAHHKENIMENDKQRNTIGYLLF